MWGGVDVVAVEVDDDLLQAVQLAYDPGDAHPGGVTARAAITIVRWAQVASRVWWKTGRAGRSCLLIRKGLTGRATARGRRR